MCCGLGEEEHTRFRKQKKKEKKLIVAKNGLVGMKGYLFFAVFKLFLNKTTFYTKLSKWFLGPKTKSRDSLPRNLAQTYNLLFILKLLLKFHTARSHCSRVTHKSLKLRIL